MRNALQWAARGRRGGHPGDARTFFFCGGIAFRFMQAMPRPIRSATSPPELQERLINDLGRGRIGPRHRGDERRRPRLLDGLPESVAERLVASLSPQTRASTQAILDIRLPSGV